MVSSTTRFGLWAIIAVITFLTPLNVATADYLTYRAATGQSGTAEFAFRGASNLELLLTNTTGSEMAGSSGILTSVGVRLPDSATFVRKGTVSIGTPSSSSSLSAGVFQSAADVSAGWGVSVRGKTGLLGAGKYDQISSLKAKGIKRFKASNQGGNKALRGAQGRRSKSAKQGTGLLNNNSVLMRLTVDANVRKRGVQGLSSEQQAAFLASLIANSVLEFGVGAAFAYPVALDPILSTVTNPPAADSPLDGSIGLTDLLDIIGTTPTPTSDETLVGSATISDLGSAVVNSPDPDLPLSDWSDGLSSTFNPGGPGSGNGPNPLTFTFLDNALVPSSLLITATSPEPSSICLLAIGAVTVVGYRFCSGRGYTLRLRKRRSPVT